MSEQVEKNRPIRVHNSGWIGSVWFIGWLFTIAYAGLSFWQSVIALVGWPYYLGLALR